MKLMTVMALTLFTLSSWGNSLNLQCKDKELDISIRTSAKEVIGNFSDVDFHATFVKRVKTRNSTITIYEDIFQGVKASISQEHGTSSIELTFPDFQWTLGCTKG